MYTNFLETTLHSAASQYMRGLWVRKPLSKHWQGRPMSLFDEEAKAYFLAAGYAVATIDVRPAQRYVRA